MRRVRKATGLQQQRSQPGYRRSSWELCRPRHGGRLNASASRWSAGLRHRRLRHRRVPRRPGERRPAPRRRDGAARREGPTTRRPYLQRSRSANTSAQTVAANATAKRIFRHVRGPSARYDKRSIDTVATYVVRAGMPELQADLGASLTVYNDALGYVTKSNLFELMRLSPDVLTGSATAGRRSTSATGRSRRWPAWAPSPARPSAATRRASAGRTSAGPTTSPTTSSRRGAATPATTATSARSSTSSGTPTTPRRTSAPAREFRSLHQRFGRYADPYFAQADEAGPQEYFADLCRAYWTGGHGEVSARFGRETAAWMKQTVPR